MNLTDFRRHGTSPFRRFVGRRAELDELERTLDENTSQNRSTCIFISGIHRIGKTALALAFSESRLNAEPNKLVYINLQQVLVPTAETLLEFIFSEIPTAESSGETSGHVPKPTIYSINDKISRLPADWLIIFDELELLLEFISPVDFIHLLRALTGPYTRLSEGPRPSMFIITRSIWPDLEWTCVQDSPGLNGIETIWVGNLRNEDVLDLLSDYTPQLERTPAWQSSFSPWVAKICGGHPFLLSAVLKGFERVRPSESVISEVLESTVQRSRGYFASIWQDLTPWEKGRLASHTLMEVSEATHTPISPDLIVESRGSRGDSTLKLRGLLAHSGTGAFSPLFTWWIGTMTTVEREDPSPVRHQPAFDWDKIKKIFETTTSIFKAYSSVSSFLTALGYFPA